jgi:hypothetical protein
MTNELGLKGITRDVYAIIYGFSQKTGQTYNGSISYLTEFTGASRKSVILALKELVNKGYLHKEDIWKGNIKYCAYSCIPRDMLITIDGGVKITPVQKFPKTGVKITLGGCKNFQKGGVKNTPNNINNNINNNIRERGNAPTLEEIKKLCKDRNNNIDPVNFYSYYEAKGWPVNWQAMMQRWECINYEGRARPGNSFNDFQQNEYDFDELEKRILDN